MPAGKRVSSTRDGELRTTIPGAWIPAIHAGMTVFGKAYIYRISYSAFNPDEVMRLFCRVNKRQLIHRLFRMH